MKNNKWNIVKSYFIVMAGLILFGIVVVVYCIIDFIQNYQP